MAAPSGFTRTNIATEGLKLAGYSSPTSAQLSRAYTWMELIKNDITFEAKDLMPLMVDAAIATTNGQFRYSLPSDYASIVSMVAIHGSITGTAQTGASGSITLASGTTIGTTQIVGYEIFIYSGTGAGSLSNCTAYDTSTLIASVTPNFNTAPDSTSKYMIVDYYYPLQELPAWDYENKSNMATGTPESFFTKGDADNGEFLVYPSPYNANAQFGLKLKYYTDLSEVDLTEGSTLISTLYKRWWNVWVQGVKAFALDELSDRRADVEMAKYKQMIKRIGAKETYGANQSGMQIKVVE